MELVFATNNAHKLTEIKTIFPPEIRILSLKDISCFEDIPEPFFTLAENALGKALHVYNNYNKNCFADDTGLEIDALKGEPGVFSARYAGPNCTSEDNVQKVLKLLEGVTNRKARFKTVIALILEGKKYTFEGIAEGAIIEAKRGNKGFGYDPIFLPTGYTQTFAELSLNEKNKISHRALATNKLIDFFVQIKNK